MIPLIDHKEIIDKPLINPKEIIDKIRISFQDGIDTTEFSIVVFDTVDDKLNKTVQTKICTTKVRSPTATAYGVNLVILQDSTMDIQLVMHDSYFNKAIYKNVVGELEYAEIYNATISILEDYYRRSISELSDGLVDYL